jgi:hypothetical protein
MKFKMSINIISIDHYLSLKRQDPTGQIFESNISIFDGIRFGLFERDIPDTYSRWIANSPTTSSYFTELKVIHTSVDYRPKESFGSRGRKGLGKGKGKGKGKGTGQHIGPVVLAVYDDIERGIMQTTEYRKKTGATEGYHVYRY